MVVPGRLFAPGLHDQLLSRMGTVGALAAPILYEAPFESLISTVSDPFLFLSLGGPRQPRPHLAGHPEKHMASNVTPGCHTHGVCPQPLMWWVRRMALQRGDVIISHLQQRRVTCVHAACSGNVLYELRAWIGFGGFEMCPVSEPCADRRGGRPLVTAPVTYLRMGRPDSFSGSLWKGTRGGWNGCII